MRSRVRALIRAIREGDQASVERAVLRLSGSRHWLAPLALAVGAFVMLFDGVRAVFSNWRLMLVQVLPAIWIWVAMLDLKLHALHGRSFHALRGPVLIPIVAAIIAITAASFFLNALFAFAITRPQRPEIRPAVDEARAHLTVIIGSGAFVGLLLGLSTMVVSRWGRPWFGLCLSVVVGIMMLCYVAVPARLIGARPARSRRDKLLASAVAGALGAAVCAPAYLLGRIGILMLGSHALLVPGIIIVVAGFTLQAGATGAVKAIKVSASLMAGRSSPQAPA